MGIIGMNNTATTDQVVRAPDFASFTSRAAMVAWAAGRAEAALREALATRGRASLVVPGGRTPVPAFEALSHATLAWDKVSVTLTDERWTEPGGPDANETLVRDHLMDDHAASLSFVPLRQQGATPAEALPAVEAALAAMPRPFDLVWLGMGTDGHIASLFPHADGVAAALDLDASALACAITPDPLPENAPYPRLSLTRRALLDARAILLMVTGEDKRAMLTRAQDGQEDMVSLPVRAVLDDVTIPVTICWAP